MSLTFSTVAGTSLVTIALSGAVSSSEIDAFKSHLESVVAAEGSVRLLVEVTGSSDSLSSGETDPMALFKEAKESGLAKQIAKAALVTDDTKLRAVASTMRFLIPFKVKAFATDDHGAALEWVTD